MTYVQAAILVRRFDALSNDIRGSARREQMAIANRFKGTQFPDIDSYDDYNTSQDIGMVIHYCEHGVGDYYPDWLRDEIEDEMYRHAMTENDMSNSGMPNHVREGVDEMKTYL